MTDITQQRQLYDAWKANPLDEAITIALTQSFLYDNNFDNASLIIDYFLKHVPQHESLLEAKMQILYNKKEYDEAEHLVRQLLPIKATSMRYMFLGHIAKRRELYEEAIPYYKKALKLAKDKKEKSDLYDFLGHVYMFAYYFDKAQHYYNKALDCNNRNESAKIHQINSFCREGEFAKAYRLANQYVKKYSDSNKIMMNAAIAFLSNGDYEKAWPLFTHRWDNKYYTQFKRDYNIPIWQGEPLQGKKLFIQGEQGIGDVLLFLGFLPRVALNDVTVYLATDKRLMPLIQRSFPYINDGSDYYMDEASGAKHYECDYILLLCDLPLILHLTNHKDHRIAPYLNVDGARRDALHFAIKKQYDDKKIIGFCWWSLADSDMRDRSIPVHEVMAHIRADDRVLVPLQYGEEQLDKADSYARDNAIIYHREHSVDNHQDLDGLAALTHACDVIITNDQSIINFAGLMGKKCLLLLPYAPNWHYAHATKQAMCEKNFRDSDVVWYDDITTLLKRKNEPWSDALARMHDAIHCYIDKA